MTQQDYDRYLDDFGARLARAAAPDPAPTRPPRRRLALGLGGTAVATAAVVATVLAVGGGAAGERLDVVAQAQAALAPEGKIVHMVVRTEAVLAGSGARPTDSGIETWTASDPRRWRLRQDVNGAGSVIVGGRFRRLRGTQEVSFAAGSMRTYMDAYDEVRVQRGYREDSRATEPPVLLRTPANDPADGFQEMLRRGTLRDAGEQQVDGRTVRRLTTTEPIGPETTRTVVYDVDPQTFAPVGGSYTTRTKGRPKGFTFRFRVTTYETFPDTPANAPLLRTAYPEGTRIVVRSAAKLRADEAAMRAWRKRCRRIASGGLRCPAPPFGPGGFPKKPE